MPIPAPVLVATLLLAPMVALAQEPTRSSQRETPGRLLALVTEIDTEVPLAGATIRLVTPNRPEVGRLTDDSGHASFTDLVPGPYVIEIERLGYREARGSLNLRAGALTTVTAEMVPEVLELEPIVVTTTRRGADMGGFEQRRRRSIGYFITRADFETNPTSRVTDVLRSVPGVRVAPGGGLELRGNCRPDVVVDGVQLRPFGGLTIDEFMMSHEVEAIEVYHGLATPVRFGSNPCGAVVVWTLVPEPSPGDGSFWKRLAIAGGFMAIARLLTR